MVEWKIIMKVILPLIPKVGPWLGCRIHVITFFFKHAPNDWDKPMTVVLLPEYNQSKYNIDRNIIIIIIPSPRGVGVIPVTTIYLPLDSFNLGANFEILALNLPYGSYSSWDNPISLASCTIGLHSCFRAIDMSLRV